MRIKNIFAALIVGMLAISSIGNTADAQYYAQRSSSLAGTTLLKVRNYTSFPIVTFVAVAHHNSFFSNWSSVHNLLPAGAIILPHRQVTVNFPACIVDIHVVTASGAQHDSYNVNVCPLTYYSIVGW